MKKKVLITGVTGFAGSFLAEHLLNSSEVEIFGSYLTDDSLINVDSISDKINLTKIDLLNSPDVKNFISESSPDLIFHLAGLASPGQSFENPASYINGNVSSLLNILEEVRSQKINPKILVVSSAEVYGATDADHIPTDENAPLMPNNPYAVSKLAQDFLALQYFLSYKIPIIRVRPYNHIGPRQSPQFVVAAFAKKIADIEKGKMEPVLKVGNLTAKRDFTDVRDMVSAYVEILEKGEEGEVYNIGSGKSYKIEDVLNKLLSFTDTKIEIRQDESLMRPIDVPELLCDNSKMKKTTGWETKFGIDQTLKETLEYWRNQK
ncbi:MAG TPA: GDP-mannose 4,6-dehydratase [Patescibacteria group bacterium]|nr:GDP-mannose 4,6-dehydratase [Patescibacteria group bacterium]